MKIIKDANGKEWNLNLTFGAIEQIKAETGVDLLDLEHLKLDALKLAHILAAACRDVKDRQAFINGFDGDTIEAAGEALWEEMIRFFPKRRRETVQKLVATARKVQDAALTAVDAKLENGEMEKTLAKLLSEPSGASLGSSASTPTPSPSAS